MDAAIHLMCTRGDLIFHASVVKIHRKECKVLKEYGGARVIAGRIYVTLFEGLEETTPSSIQGLVVSRAKSVDVIERFTLACHAKRKPRTLWSELRKNTSPDSHDAASSMCKIATSKKLRLFYYSLLVQNRWTTPFFAAIRILIDHHAQDRAGGVGNSDEYVGHWTREP